MNSYLPSDSYCLAHPHCDGLGPNCPKVEYLPKSVAGMTRFDILHGANFKPEYGERLTRTWYGYCREWFTNVKGKPPAKGKVRIFDPLHRWESE